MNIQIEPFMGHYVSAMLQKAKMHLTKAMQTRFALFPSTFVIFTDMVLQVLAKTNCEYSEVTKL
jgi:hypothetical protein